MDDHDIRCAADMILAEHENSRALTAALETGVIAQAYREAVARAPEYLAPALRMAGALRMFAAHGVPPAGLQLLFQIVAAQEGVPVTQTWFQVWDQPLPPEPRTPEGRALEVLFDVVVEAYLLAGDADIRQSLDDVMRRRYPGFDLSAAEDKLFRHRQAG